MWFLSYVSEKRKMKRNVGTWGPTCKQVHTPNYMGWNMNFVFSHVLVKKKKKKRGRGAHVQNMYVHARTRTAHVWIFKDNKSI